MKRKEVELSVLLLELMEKEEIVVNRIVAFVAFVVFVVLLLLHTTSLEPLVI